LLGNGSAATTLATDRQRLGSTRQATCPSLTPLKAEALALVDDERGPVYGPPEEDFSRAGRIWGAILDKWRDSGEPDVPPELVALCLIGVKQSRLVETPSDHDSAVDISGYAQCLDRVQRWRRA